MQKCLNEINDWDFDSRKCKPDNKKFPISAVENRKMMLDGLQVFCMSCRLCSLGHRLVEEKGEKFNPHCFSNMVDSKFVVVGQNPGFNECLKGEPFVGQSGKNFDDELAKHGLNRKQFYITNTVKCFTPGNEEPSGSSRASCGQILKLELDIIQPKLIITLGKSPFTYLCSERKYSEALGKITKTDFVVGGMQLPVYAVYHPSPLNINAPERRADFEKQIAMLAKLMKRL